MKRLKPAGWAGALCVFLMAASSWIPAIAQEPQAELAKAIRKQLDKQFDGWTVAPAPACPGASSHAAADIDFDRSGDVALIVNTPAGEPRVVIAMPRVIGGAIVHDMGPLAAIPGATHVVVLPQGRVVRAPGAMFDDHLSGPTFAVASCERPIVAFVWTGYSFRKIPVS